MTDDLIIQFGVDSQQIRIILHNRPYPESPYARDRDAITATVEVKSGGFQGRIPTMVWSHELEHLSLLLMNLSQQVGHSEQARFDLREGILSLVFEFIRVGHVDVQVTASDMDPDPTVLTFLMQADRTFLSIWSSEITRTLAQFQKE